MDTWSKCYTFFILVFVCLPSNASIQNESENGDAVTTNLRKRRQNGYLYDKPNISFNLPSRPVVTTTTPLPAVNGMPAQMYYAYPVPVEITTKTVVQSNTGSTATGAADGSGYNFDIQNPGLNQISGNTANIGHSSSGSIATGAAGDSGYNYERQDTKSTRGSGNNANVGYSNTASKTADGSGYNYERQDSGLTQGSGNSGNAGYTSTTSRTADGSGYNYEKQDTGSTQGIGNIANAGYSSTTSAIANGSGYIYEGEDTAVSRSTGNNANVGYSSSGSTNTETGGGLGYSYTRQDSGVSQANDNTASIGYKSSGSSGTSSDLGYNYERQSIAKTEPIVKPQLSYIPSRHTQENNQNTDVSTNAPKYLPPTENTETLNKPFEYYLPPQTKHSSEVQSPGTSARTKSRTPLNTGYLTPIMDNSGVEVTGQQQTGVVQKSTGNIPTKIPNAQQPSSGYLTSNLQNSNTQRLGMMRTINAHQYLPPANTYLTASQVPSPAITYLPPIFN